MKANMNFHEWWNSIDRLAKLITWANWGIAASLLSPGHIVVQSVLSGGREAQQYANKIASVFTDAGWNVEPPNGRGMLFSPTSGVVLVAGRDAPTALIDLFANALIAGGIAKAPVEVSPDQNTPVGTVAIWVAGRPAR
jgi:hypothetical protein